MVKYFQLTICIGMHSHFPILFIYFFITLKYFWIVSGKWLCMPMHQLFIIFIYSELDWMKKCIHKEIILLFQQAVLIIGFIRSIYCLLKIVEQHQLEKPYIWYRFYIPLHAILGVCIIHILALHSPTYPFVLCSL